VHCSLNLYTQAEWNLPLYVLVCIPPSLRPKAFARRRAQALNLSTQADPPTLKDAAAWSPDFHDFLARCLIKVNEA
jgi:hypothetical protein